MTVTEQDELMAKSDKTFKEPTKKAHNFVSGWLPTPNLPDLPFALACSLGKRIKKKLMYSNCNGLYRTRGRREVRPGSCNT